VLAANMRKVEEKGFGELNFRSVSG